MQGTINAVSGKWKVLAIWHLGFGPKRFAQLRKLLPGISEKVLAAQLRQLETDGIINRKTTHSSPPQVTYSLTVAGEEFMETLADLCAWGSKHLGIPPNLPATQDHVRLPQLDSGESWSTASCGRGSV